MKKKVLSALLTVFCIAGAAFAFTACDSENNENVNGNGNGNGNENPPAAVLKDSPEPINILTECDSTSIYVLNAVYEGEEDLSEFTEYKLDDYDWAKAKTSEYDTFEAIYEGLEPASTHTVYARCGAHGEYKASEEYSVTVTLEKGFRRDFPETASYDVEGKTVTVTLEEGVEVSFDNRETYTSNGTFTYTETGLKTFYLRYGETNKYLAGPEKNFNILITDFAGGFGTKENPYRIDNLEQFKTLRTASYVRDGDWCKLTSDIEFDETILDKAERGSLINIDGGGHKLISPKTSSPLFYEIGTAENLIIEQAEYISDLGSIGIDGALLSVFIQQAENVSVSGSITINNNKLNYFRDYCVSVGGIATYLFLPYTGGDYGMNNCRVDLNVSLPDTSSWSYQYYSLALGGLASTVTCHTTETKLARISACSVNLNVSGGVFGYGDIGGLVGGLVASSEASSSKRETPPIEVSDCYTAGSISLKTVSHALSGSKRIITRIGGIAPAVCGSIERCYSAIEFDINADVYAGTGDEPMYELRAGGIVAEGEKNGMQSPVLSNVLFAGKTTVKDITAESKKGSAFHVETICAKSSAFVSPSKLYFDETVLSVPEGAEQVSFSAYDTKVSASELKTLNWQKTNLAWDETIWNLQEGKLPELK